MSKKEKTVKVVINKCYGGFGISQKALMQLIESNSTIVEKTPEKEYFPDDDKVYKTNKERQQHIDWCEMIWQNGFVYRLDDMGANRHTVRANPDLIRVVEALREEANGMHAELKIVEIPADIGWSVHEYDGVEWIAEDHRTWG